jgi:hypothetical protein
MNIFSNGAKRWKLALPSTLAAMALAGGAFSRPALAQPIPLVNPTGAPTGAAGSRANASTGSAETAAEDRLMGTLASREMDSLLNYYFEKHHITPERQDVVKSIVAWREMGNPNLPLARRRQLIAAGIKGLSNFLNATRDTETLMTRAGQLIEYGMKGQINQIEYFGGSSTLQAELNESAEAVVKMLDKAIEECEAQENQLLVGQTRPSPALLQKWQALDDRLQTARWTKAFSSYALVLSLDGADPRQKEIADAALTFLTEYEKPEYQREVAVKTQMGKLMMVKGDTAGAVAKFKEALAVPKIEKLGQYEARFYTTLAYLLGKKEAESVASLAELQKWCAENLPESEQKAVSAGVGLLDYRINELRSDLAKDAATKKQFADAGEAALSKVMQENPKLEPIIKKMLLAKLPADADISKLDTVLLRSLEARGVDEVLRAKEGEADARGKPVLEQAIKAAGELQKRAGQPNVTDDVIDEASFLEPVYYAKLGKHVETVEESLDYLKNHGKDPDRKRNAMANALASVEVLRKSPDSTSQKVSELIDRAWMTAVDSGMKQYTFVYGKRLFDEEKFKEAAAVLKQVPENHPAITHARFYELSSLQEELDEKGMEGAPRQALVEEIQRLAADVNKRIEADLATTEEKHKPRLRFYQVSAILLSADLMQKELKDNAGVLKLLDGFEAKAKGLPREDKLEGTALHLRVNAYMALKRTQDAVEEVKKLVANGGTGAANILFTMIGQMDDAYVKAKLNGDKGAMQQNSGAQVALITALIDQTKDESIRNKYEQWKADLLLRAASNEDDATKKSGYLSEAQATYVKLLGLATEGTPQHDTMRYKLALVSYELKDYKKVQQELGQLIADGTLGRPVIDEVNPVTNEITFKDNGVYWEGLLRFMQANYELSKTDKSPELADAVKNAQETLKSMYINRGKNVGGDRLRDEYAKLKADLLPGWDETKVSATTQASATSKPAGAAK